MHRNYFPCIRPTFVIRTHVHITNIGCTLDKIASIDLEEIMISPSFILSKSIGANNHVPGTEKGAHADFKKSSFVHSRYSRDRNQNEIDFHLYDRICNRDAIQIWRRTRCIRSNPLHVLRDSFTEEKPAKRG